MVVPVQRQPAYVLHRRPYRETSAIVELLTRDFGRVPGVMRGTRGPRRGQPVEPFSRLEVAWRGRGQLVTVTTAEVVERVPLAGTALYAGLYLNEMLVRALREEEAMDRLFDAYDAALKGLEQTADLEPVLRRFEKTLLRELGFELECTFDADSGLPVEANKQYTFVDGVGFCQAAEGDDQAFAGEVLMLIEQDRYEREDVRRSAKRLLRAALRPHVGDRPFESRALFRGRGR